MRKDEKELSIKEIFNLTHKFQFKGVDLKNWNTLKLENDNGKIIGAIRYRQSDGFMDVGRLMIHPDYRHRGLAQILLSEVDHLCPKEIKELYTCTKSWSNIQLYEKMGYKPYKKIRMQVVFLLCI